MRKKTPQNFLDYIPCPLAKSTVKDGRVFVTMVHHGFFAWVASRFFHRPKESLIEFDELGSFVWKEIDGEKDVEQIAQSVKAHFGEKAEPLYERLISFCRILSQNGMISFKMPDRSVNAQTDAKGDEEGVRT